VKNTPSTLKTLLKRVWKKDGDSRQDSTFPYSEMPGVLDPNMNYKNEQHERAMKAPINDGGNLEKRAREAGL
jgi:hypothetical protein